MGFVVDIITKEEALALPPDKRPLCYRIPEKIFTAVHQAVGAASLCWDPRPTGVFDSTQASKFAAECCVAIAEELERLGITFGEINGPSAPPSAPFGPKPITHTLYRTVVDGRYLYSVRCSCGVSSEPHPLGMNPSIQMPDDWRHWDWVVAFLREHAYVCKEANP